MNSAAVSAPATSGGPAPAGRAHRDLVTTEPAPTPLIFTPSTRVLWRSATQVQLELGARRVVVDGLPSQALDRLVGPRVPTEDTVPTPDAAADDTIDDLLGVLFRAGFLSHRPSDRPVVAPAAGDADGGSEKPRSGSRAELAPDLAALGERFGGRSGQVMDARQRRTVKVEGTGRLPALIAPLLAAGGVGHVHLEGAGDVTLWDAAPGGILRADEGRRRAPAGHEAVQRSAPGTDTRWVPHADADLVVLAGAFAPAAQSHRILTAAGIAHLSSTVWASSAVVGPLVIPRVTSCVGCADLHREDRDPAWPAMAAQIAAVRNPPSDVSVCVLAAALTALQAFAYLDGEMPTTADGTLEMSLPDWRIRRRSWSVHESCACHG